MKNIVVDKEFLKGYDTLLIGLENCDVYEINVADILEIYCEATLITPKKNVYGTIDGFIKISAKASNTVECFVLRNNKMGTQCDYRLKERLEMCGGGADMTSFSLKDKQNRQIEIYVPYNPLEGVLHGSEIELSNCPSLEIDIAGNMIISFGESSKQPKRKDNNYDELIVGWKHAFKDYLPKVLKVKVKSFSTFGDGQTDFLFYFEICDKNCKKDIELVFKDCKNITVEMFFPEKGDCEIVMSKMADGCLYVGFDGLGIEFTCASAIEYEYYCNRNKE